MLVIADGSGRMLVATIVKLTNGLAQQAAWIMVLLEFDGVAWLYLVNAHILFD
jgi:hypothetical protein